MRGRVGEGHPDILGLGAVDEVAEDPAATTEALAVATLAAEPAGAARRDARDEDPVPDLDPTSPRADLLDRADGLVAEDPTRRHRRDVALQDVQIGATDRDRVDPHDGVGVGLEHRHGDVLPCCLAGSVVDERLHICLLER